MFKLDFEHDGQNQERYPHHYEPQLKTEYAAGFRHFEGKQPVHQPDSPSLYTYYHSVPQQSVTQQVLEYVKQLGIDNLPNLYYQITKNLTKPDLTKLKHQQQKSITRLYQPLPTKPLIQDPPLQPQPPKKSSNDIWTKDPKYNHIPLQFMVNHSLMKLHKKVINQLKSICKYKGIEPIPEFMTVFASFIMLQFPNILSALGRHLSPQQKDMEIYYIWKSFLSTTKLSTLQKKSQLKTISNQNLTQLRTRSCYLYTLILPNEENEELTLDKLKNIIRKQFVIESKQIINNFAINKQYTNPYNIEYNKPNQNTIKSNNDENQPTQKPNKFKANTIPNSTYQPPKQQKPRQKKITTAHPFNLTTQHKQLSPDQYYHWNRQFKANPIPTTTYNPHKPTLMSDQQKKARSIQSLQKAHYPPTMQDLNNYQKQKQQKLNTLAKKYQKIHSQTIHQQIPNFISLHAQEILQLQELKQKNKKIIDIQPFHLSVNKNKPNTSINYYTSYLPNRNISTSPKPSPPITSKSTKKFNALINYRKSQQTTKQKTLSLKLQTKQKQTQKKKPLLDIIKNRVSEQLHAHPIKKNKFQINEPDKIEIDREKIYREQPLLMKSSLPEQQYNLPWKPIF